MIIPLLTLPATLQHINHCKKDSQRVKWNPNTSVNMPMLDKLYNNGMGEVDVMDRLLGSYRPIIRGNKWYWPLVINGPNVSVVAACRLHSALAAKLVSHLAFRREIALCLLKTPTKFLRSQVTGGKVPHLPSSLRFDGVDYTKVTCTQGRCKMCQINTRYMCDNARYACTVTEQKHVLSSIISSFKKSESFT